MGAPARRGLRAAASSLALAALLGSCAYFNALHNAKRDFAQAERAADGGDRGTADMLYLSAARSAVRSLDRSPDGRWSDDALLIIGRAHFGRRDFPPARAALLRLLEREPDARVRAIAEAYLGASVHQMGDAEEGARLLDAALSSRELPSAVRGLAHLWRARARFDLDDPDGGWEELERARAGEGRAAREAALEMIASGLRFDRPEWARAGFERIARLPAGARTAEHSYEQAISASERWGPAVARELLEPFERSSWRIGDRGGLLLVRAELAAAAGDTAAAIADATWLAEATGGVRGQAARVLAARLRLASADSVEDLAPVRAVLLPALADSAGRRLVHAIRMLDILLERPESRGQALALFAAAELARDQLEAPRLARAFFLDFADREPGSPYAPKALLAAAELSAPSEEAPIRARLARGDGVYLAAARGEPVTEEYRAAEERLDRALTLLLIDAAEEAVARDATVARRVAEIDSLRQAALADSIREVCVLLLDTIPLGALPADSAEAACIRGDTLRLDSIVRGLLEIRPDTASADTADGGVPNLGDGSS